MTKKINVKIKFPSNTKELLVVKKKQSYQVQNFREYFENNLNPNCLKYVDDNKAIIIDTDVLDLARWEKLWSRYFFDENRPLEVEDQFLKLCSNDDFLTDCYLGRRERQCYLNFSGLKIKTKSEFLYLANNVDYLHLDNCKLKEKFALYHFLYEMSIFYDCKLKYNRSESILEFIIFSNLNEIFSFNRTNFENDIRLNEILNLLNYFGIEYILYFSDKTNE